MSYAEQRIQEIIGWETRDEPDDRAGILFMFTILTGSASIRFLTLQTPDLAGITGLFCFAPSLTLSLWVLRFHLEHDKKSKNIIKNARNCAVPSLPKPYHHNVKRSPEDPKTIYEELLEEIDKLDD